MAGFTYIRLEDSFTYPAAFLDARSRKVVGYAISQSIDMQLALAALGAAVRSRRPVPGECIGHTERGCQFTSSEYRRALARDGLVGSMSAPANPYDNAQAESFMKTLKVEAQAANPRRWTRNTRNWTPIGAVTLNPEKPELIKTESSIQAKQAIAA
jgi:putative transposase